MPDVPRPQDVIAHGAHDVVTAAIQHGRDQRRNRSSARLAGAALEALANAGYAVVQLPEPTATNEDSDYGPTCLARWESLETGEITAWPGGVVGIWDVDNLEPDDARALAALLAASAAAAAVSGANKTGAEGREEKP